MERFMVLDAFSIAVVTMILFLALCVAVLVSMRDRRSTPESLATRFVQCPHRRQAAVVTFVESMRTGLLRRSVQSCSLLDVGVRCEGGCCYLPPSELTTEPNARVTENVPASA